MTTSLILSTFNQPRLLELSLAAFAAQVPPPAEIVVADDGSGPETGDLILRVAPALGVPVHHRRQEKDGFRLARIRNLAVAASSGDYLVFADGDSIPLPGFLAAHEAARRPRRFLSGRRLQLPREATERLTPETARTGAFAPEIPASEWAALRAAVWKDRFYRWTRLRESPKLLGGHFSLSREDYDAVNGSDEAYRGWGLEDDDLGRRLARAGVRPGSVVATARLVHLHHPPSSTTPGKTSRSLNAERFRRPAVLTRCVMGISPRDVRRIPVLVTPGDARPTGEEIEVLRFPSARRFRGRAEVRILWIEGPEAPPWWIVRQATVVAGGGALFEETAFRRFLAEIL